MFNANQSQTLILLITWPNMSALRPCRPKMGNPPPYQRIPYTTPSNSIHLCSQKQPKKIVKLPDKSCRENHRFLIIPRDHNEGYNYLPDYLHPWKNSKSSPRFRVAILQSKISHKHYCGLALHARGFTKSPTIDFCNYTYMHRCQSDYSIQIEGYNFTIWNRTSKNKCLKYENDTKTRENSFRKNSLTIKAFAKEKYLVYPN